MRRSASWLVAALLLAASTVAVVRWESSRAATVPCQACSNAGASGADGRSRAGSLISAPSMHHRRSAHSATSLRDGRVLIAGGFHDQEATHGAESYDPDRNRFLPLAPMITRRHSHTATLLPDGKLLIVGEYGAGNTTLAAVEIFNPTTQTFTPAASLRAARAGHIATLLGNGKVLIAGGVGPDWRFLASAELYDPATDTFTPTGSMSVARESHAAVRLHDGRVLIVGGHRDRRENIQLYASAETYDPRTGVFTRVGDMGIRRHKHDAVLLRDGRVMVTGGSDERDDRGVYDSSEFFHPQTGDFTPGPRMNLGRYKHAGSSVLLANGRVLISGGAKQVEIYDPRIDAFVLVGGSTRIAGRFSATALLQGGGVLITGGYGSPGMDASAAWLYRT